MLGFWRSHADYQRFIIDSLRSCSAEALCECKDEIPILFILNLDKLKKVIEPLYSHTGRSDLFQPEIFRSLLLMQCLDFKLDNWPDKLRNCFVLRTSSASISILFLPSVLITNLSTDLSTSTRNLALNWNAANPLKSWIKIRKCPTSTPVSLNVLLIRSFAVVHCLYVQKDSFKRSLPMFASLPL